jgi:hypothetical protein
VEAAMTAGESVCHCDAVDCPCDKRIAAPCALCIAAPDLLALVSAQLRGEAEHDTDEDGVHWSGEHYRGRKGGMRGNCDGCRWSDAASAAIAKEER